MLVEYGLGYLDKTQKIVVDDAYKKVFHDWVYNNVVGLEVEFASRLSSEKGFVRVKWRWGSAAMELKEFLHGWDSSEGTQKTTKKRLGGTPQILPKHGYYSIIAK